MTGNWKKYIGYSVSGLVVVWGVAILLFSPYAPPERLLTERAVSDQGFVFPERSPCTQQHVPAVTSVVRPLSTEKDRAFSQVDAQDWKNNLKAREGVH